MIGKKIRLNDYRFNYGSETVFLNVFFAFKNKDNGNKYVVYSYDNTKLYYGSMFVRNNEIVVMISKGINEGDVKSFVFDFVENKVSDTNEIISLDNINSIQIIDEAICDFKVDVNKLYELTIPKPAIKVEEEKPKKKISFVSICIIVLFVLVVLFLFINPEVIMGKNKYYLCSKSYNHNKLPALVNEEVSLVFNGKDNITSIDVRYDYLFSNVDYYKEFKDKNYFYQYFNDGDTYKFDDNSYTYRLFSSIDTEVDYFLPRELDELILHYENDNYICKMTEEE